MPRLYHGYTITKDGYIRITAGIHRGQYKHRVVMEKALGRKLKEDEEVHHQDFNVGHNCLGNLILFGPGIHEHIPKRHELKKRFS